MFDLDGLPCLVDPSVGITLQGGDVGKSLAVSATLNRGHVGIILWPCLEDKLDEQLIRFEVHHVVVFVVFLVQSLDFTVKGEGNGFQDGRFAATHGAENAEEVGLGEAGEVDGLSFLVGVQTLEG